MQYALTVAVPIGRFVQELMAYLPKSTIVTHNFEVSVLNVFDSPDVYKQSLIILKKLVPLLQKYSAQCGVSEAFSTLSEFKNACIQASHAQTLGCRLKAYREHWQSGVEVLDQIAFPKTGSEVFHYNDFYLYLMLHYAQSEAFDTFMNTSCISTLRRLLEYDKEKNTSLIQVLYTHLVCERRATMTGRLLNMHRNSVLYHISRIEDITGIDLNDYWTRLKLIITFHLFELRESNNAFISQDNVTQQ